MSGSVPGFHALIYHEIVPLAELPNGGREVTVSDGYRDVLPDRLFVAVDEFKRQMRWLAEHGYVSVTLSDVKAFYFDHAPPPEHSVLLCFDDLYQSVKQHAYPVLRELGFHAVGFVVHDWIFPDPQPPNRKRSITLSWAELDEMHDVFEYAHHSAGFHTRGPDGPALQSATRTEIRDDIERGAERLDEPHIYAYPFGLSSLEAVAWLAETGVRLAFTTQSGYNNADTPKLQLNRTGVLRTTSFAEFVSALK